MSTNVYDSKHVIHYGDEPSEYHGFVVTTSSTEYHAEYSPREKIWDLIHRIGNLKPKSKRGDIHYIAGLAYCIYHAREEWESEALRELLDEEVPDGNMNYKILEIAREISE